MLIWLLKYLCAPTLPNNYYYFLTDCILYHETNPEQLGLEVKPSRIKLWGSGTIKILC